MLEAGCGYGKWIKVLWETITFYVIDFSIEDLKIIIKNITNSFIVIRDIRDLPFKSGTFELILSSVMLEYFVNTNELSIALKEAYSTFSKNGILILFITVPICP